MNTRLIFTAAAMPADQARAIVELICAASPERAAEQRRNRIERHFYQALLRILKFAKHETLRKLQRYLYSHRPLTGQDEAANHPDSVRIAFSVNELKRDLLAMLDQEGRSALDRAASDTLDLVGFRDPWKLPAQDTLDFIARRQNLLSNVPQEIFDTIREEISTGLNKGESIRDLSKRISSAFDEIGKERAQVIAQTETAAAYGFASDKAARAAGISYKKWIHSVISKVPRPDHLAIDGLIIPMDEAYPVGNPPLMFPHAPDGAAEDVINCRCMSIPVSEADYEAQMPAKGKTLMEVFAEEDAARIAAGDVPGHEFRGNQYVSIAGHDIQNIAIRVEQDTDRHWRVVKTLNREDLMALRDEIKRRKIADPQPERFSWQTSPAGRTRWKSWSRRSLARNKTLTDIEKLLKST